jgi:hypothetical protein
MQHNFNCNICREGNQFFKNNPHHIGGFFEPHRLQSPRDSSHTKKHTIEGCEKR